MDEHSQHGGQGSGGGGAGRYIFWGFLLIAAYFLITEHRAHVVQYLPYLLLLACPLMHLFHGHGGHGGHGGGADDSADAKKSGGPTDAVPGSKNPGAEQHHHH